MTRRSRRAEQQRADVAEAVTLYASLKAEYEYDGDVFCEDADRVRAAKWIIDNRLDEADRIIFRLYTDLQSLQRLAEMLHISKSSAGKEIMRIRNRILEEYEHLRTTDIDCGGGVLCD